jgi:hypothetical protein
MTVLNFAPDRSQLMRLPIIAKYPWLMWTVKYRWQFASSGVHSGNHLMSEGISFGIRYHSQIIYSNRNHQGIDPVESPVNKLLPALLPGGRLLHLRFHDHSTLNEKISLNGYTVLIIDPAIHVSDEFITHKGDCFSPSTSLRNDDYIDCEEGTTGNSNGKGKSSSAYHSNEPFLNALANAFHSRNIPISFLDLRPYLNTLTENVSNNKAQEEIVNLYRQQMIIIVRPDLYIMWCLKSSCYYHELKESFSVLDINRIAQVACMEIKEDKVEAIVHSTTNWLNRRFITNIQGYRVLHRQASYIENEDKGEMLKMLALKKKAAEQPQKPPADGTIDGNATAGDEKKPEINYDTLLTKAMVVADNSTTTSPPLALLADSDFHPHSSHDEADGEHLTVPPIQAGLSKA